MVLSRNVFLVGCWLESSSISPPVGLSMGQLTEWQQPHQNEQVTALTRASGTEAGVVKCTFEVTSHRHGQTILLAASPRSRHVREEGRGWTPGGDHQGPLSYGQPLRQMAPPGGKPWHGHRSRGVTTGVLHLGRQTEPANAFPSVHSMTQSRQPPDALPSSGLALFPGPLATGLSEM